MKIIFASVAPAIADIHAESFARHVIEQRWPVVSVSNACVFNWLRAVLYLTPVEQRPQVTWIVEGREVHFDEEMRSTDAWCDLLEVQDRALETLLGAANETARELVEDIGRTVRTHIGPPPANAVKPPPPPPPPKEPRHG